MEPKITFLVTFGTVRPFVCYCDLVEWVLRLRALVISFSPTFKLPLSFHLKDNLLVESNGACFRLSTESDSPLYKTEETLAR